MASTLVKESGLTCPRLRLTRQGADAKGRGTCVGQLVLASQSLRTTHVPSFICNHQELKKLLQLFTLDTLRRFPHNTGAYRVITTLAESIQHRFKTFHFKVEENLVEVGFYSLN